MEDQANHEPKLWDAVWNAPLGTPAPDEFPFWARFSFGVIMIARKRFPDLKPKEYAGTCLLWALRVFKSFRDDNGADDVTRIHLFVWMAHLLDVLRSRKKRKAAV